MNADAPAGPPAVSVILPAYNAAATNGKAVESILLQRLEAFELLVVDDGSTDGTAERAESFRDPRVRILRHPENRGVIEARNTALRIARGEFLALQDADDESDPMRLKAQAEFLTAHAEVGIVGTGYWKLSPAGEPLLPRTMPETHEAIVEAAQTGTPFCCPSLMMRADAVRQAGEYRFITSQAGEDMDMILRILDFSRAANLPEPLYRYRTGHESIMSRAHTDDLTATRDLIYRIAAIRRATGVDPFEAMNPEILEAAETLRTRMATRPPPSPRQRDAWNAQVLTEDFLRAGEPRKALPWGLQALCLNPLTPANWKNAFLCLSRR